MLLSSFSITLKRKLLSGAIFGAASSLFFFCVFGLFGENGVSNGLFLLLIVVLPATAVAFLVTPSKDRHIKNCSWGKSVSAGAGITGLSYLASLTIFFWYAFIDAPPTSFSSLLKLFYVIYGFFIIGAFYILPFALPFGMLGGLLYRVLAKRTLSTD